MRRLHLAVCPSVLAALVAVVPRPALAEARCVVGSVVNVREAPRADAPRVGTLPIGTGVWVDEGTSDQAWTRVSFRQGYEDGCPVRPPLDGWVRSELLAPACVSYEQAMEQAANEPNAPAWYERAAALARSRPELVAALEGWAEKLEELKDPAAGRIGTELAALRDPARLAARNPERPVAVVVTAHVDGTADVYPITYAGAEPARLCWESQAEATSFLLRQLPVGRTLRLLSDGPGGTVTISAEPVFDLHPEAREAGMEAVGQLALARGEKPGTWLASAGELRSSARGRPLRAPEGKGLVELAGRSLLEEASKWKKAEARTARQVLPSGKAHGVARDVDGDGTEELVALVWFHSEKRRFDAYVLLVARPEAGGELRPRFTELLTSERGREILALLGSADLDGDGKEELVVAHHGPVHAYFEILIPAEGTYRGLDVVDWAD